MAGWLRRQWDDFRGSYVVDEVLLKTSPGSLAGIFVVALLFTVVPGYMEPIASYVKFRSPWLAVSAAFIAVALSYGAYAVKVRPPWGPIFILFDTSFYTASIALAASLTAPPASHAYAVILGIMLAAGQARDYALSLPFALSVCVPAIGIVFVFDRGLADVLIVSFSCALALWLSYQTRLQRALRRQNEGLRVALVASDKITNDSMDIALSSALIGIGQFLHEMRNSQTVVYANLRSLTDRELSPQDRQEALDDILLSQARIQRLIERTIDDLRSKSRVKREVFEISDALRSGCKLDSVGATCTVNLLDGPFYASGDPAQLRDVMQTLVTNAAQAGAAHIGVKCTLDASNRSATVEVIDDGPGLPPQVLERLFEPFATYGKANGTGLGLYLARRRVELTGGTLVAANAPTKGAVFTLRLPGSPSPPPQPEEVVGEPALADR